MTQTTDTDSVQSLADYLDLVGMQVVYLPPHVHGDLKHPDVEFGFITGLSAVSESVVFCRYFRKGSQTELRTRANSEATPVDCLMVYRHTDQAVVTKLLQELGYV